MKFYVVSAERDGLVVGCETSLTAARKLGASNCGRAAYVVDMVQIDMSAREAIRLLLGNLGGYAAETLRVYPPEVPR